VDFKADSLNFVETHKVKPFHGAKVHFLGFDEAEMEVMASELLRNGGQLCQDIDSKNCTHVVVDDGKVICN
jgi:hypothetical protein